jgi:thioredoxin-like negative regulator of GroEL
MSQIRRPWSFRRWRRRWRDRVAKLRLRARIWVDRHVLSRETRRRWRERWRRRSQRWGNAVEQAGFKLLPHRPDAAPENWRTRLTKRWQRRWDTWYPPEVRVEHAAALRAVWRENTAPLRAFNRRVRRAIDHYVLTSFHPPTFRKRFWNWRGLVGAVAVAALLAGVAFWLIPQWRSHQENKRAAQARLLLSRGYYSLAYQNALDVLRRNENHEPSARVLAELLERQGSPEAVAWRRRAAQLAPTVSNQLALAAAGVRFEAPPSPTARRWLTELAGESNTVAWRLVAAQFELRNNNLPAAEGHYRAALEREPGNDEIALALATVQLQTRDPVRLAMSEAELNALSARTNIGLRALRPLVSVHAARGQYAAAKEFSARILAQEHSTFDDRLVHLRLLTESRDPERGPFLARLREQVSTTPVFAAQLANWMAANGLAAEALAWLDALPASVRRAEPVLLTAAELQARLGDWAGLEQRLTAQRWGTLEFVRLAWLARAYRGLGDRRAAEDHLRRGTELAAGMTLRLAGLFRLVQGWGWDREAEDILWEVFERYPAENWASDLLQRRYFERGATRDLARVFELLVHRNPNDLSHKNNLAMLLLLTNADLPRAHRLAEAVHEQEPTSVIYASTYAFSLHRQGRGTEARQSLEALGEETLKVPSIAAYYAIICRALGDVATAREYAALARNARLLPEEAALLDAARR